jgi:DNA invertase Pin-like site-specific DNA recombinase
MIKAIAYMRTSSKTNVGEDKDSVPRQRVAIEGYAIPAGYTIAESDWFYDPAVKGEDSIYSRPGFLDMLAHIERTGARVVIVESAHRFARDLMVQEVGYSMLKKQGIALIAADSPNAFLDDSPTATMVRQILGAVAQFEKAALVAKLKAARQRKKAKTGKCSGRKGLGELRPEHVAAAQGAIGSLRTISAALAGQGILASSGKPYAASAIKSMLNQGKGV